LGGLQREHSAVSSRLADAQAAAAALSERALVVRSSVTFSRCVQRNVRQHSTGVATVLHLSALRMRRMTAACLFSNWYAVYRQSSGWKKRVQPTRKACQRRLWKLRGSCARRARAWPRCKLSWRLRAMRLRRRARAWKLWGRRRRRYGRGWLQCRPGRTKQ
jgi:hypothetical protein